MVKESKILFGKIKMVNLMKMEFILRKIMEQELNLQSKADIEKLDLQY